MGNGWRPGERAQAVDRANAMEAGRKDKRASRFRGNIAGRNGHASLDGARVRKLEFGLWEATFTRKGKNGDGTIVSRDVMMVTDIFALTRMMGHIIENHGNELGGNDEVLLKAAVENIRIAETKTGQAARLGIGIRQLKRIHQKLERSRDPDKVNAREKIGLMIAGLEEIESYSIENGGNGKKVPGPLVSKMISARTDCGEKRDSNVAGIDATIWEWEGLLLEQRRKELGKLLKTWERLMKEKYAHGVARNWGKDLELAGKLDDAYGQKKAVLLEAVVEVGKELKRIGDLRRKNGGVVPIEEYCRNHLREAYWHLTGKNGRKMSTPEARKIARRVARALSNNKPGYVTGEFVKEFAENRGFEPKSGEAREEFRATVKGLTEDAVPGVPNKVLEYLDAGAVLVERKVYGRAADCFGKAARILRGERLDRPHATRDAQLSFLLDGQQ